MSTEVKKTRKPQRFNIKNNLGNLLILHNITQRDLCRKTGIDKSVICNICTNSSKSPSLGTALKVSQALNIPLEQIFYLSDDDSQQ